MVKRYLLLLLCLLFVDSVAVAQAPRDPVLDSLLTKVSSNQCADYVYNARILIPVYFEKGLLDSIHIVIDYVDQKCGPAAFGTLHDLLAVYEGTFDRDLCDSAFLDGVLCQPRYDWHSIFSGADFLLNNLSIIPESYQLFEQQLLTLLLEEYPSGSNERLICLHHARQVNQIRKELRNREYEGTCLQEAYNTRINQLLATQYDRRFNFFGWTGVWSGLGANDLLGAKIELGLGGGLRRSRFGLDLVGLFRFLNSKDEYVVQYKGALRNTNHYLGGLIGLEGVFEPLRVGNHQAELVISGSYEGFDAIPTDDDKDHKSLGCWTYGYGLNYRLIYSQSPSIYLGVQIRYTITNFENAPGTDLSGNAISIRLVLGGMSNGGVNWQLNRLGYYDQ